jgi:hypothetical protein
MIGWQLSVPELCAYFSEKSPSSITPTENNRKGLSCVRFLAMKALPQIARIPIQQDSLLINVMKNAKYGITSVRSGTTLLNSLECHISS